MWTLIKISLKFVPKCSIHNIHALVQIMAWRRSGDKPLSEPVMASLPTHICVTRSQWANSCLICFRGRPGRIGKLLQIVQGIYSLSGKTSYRQIPWSLEAARLGVIMIVSLWNLTGISAALLPRCLLNFKAFGKVQTRILRLRDFTRSCGKTSYRLVNRGPGHWSI